MPEPRLDSVDGTTANKITITATGDVTGAKFSVFIKDVKHGVDITPTITNTTASADVDLPAVGDTDENYPLRFEVVKDSNPPIAGSPDFQIWPNPLDLTATDASDQPIGPVPFVLKGADWELKYPSDAQGKAPTCRVSKPGAVTVSLGSGWEFVDASAAATQKFRKRTYKVKRNAVAEFVSPNVTTEIEQLVNLTTTSEGRDGKGSVVKVQVRIKDAKGKNGDDIFVQAKFGRESKRNDPKPELKDATGIAETDSGKTFKGKVKLTADDQTVKFTLQLGYAGGDTCEVKIGTTDEYKDGALTFKNFRQISYEVWQPENTASGLVSSWALGGTVGTPGLAAGGTTHLDTTFATLAIKPTLKQAKYFTKANLLAQAWLPVSGGTKLIPSFKGDFFNETASNQVCILTWEQMNDLLGALSPAPANTLVQIMFADFIAEAKVLSVAHTVPSAGSTLTISNDTKLLPWSIVDADARTITKLSWRADVRAGTPPVWQTDPDGHGWQDITAEDEVNAHVTIGKFNKLTVAFPNVPLKAYYPGTYIATKAPSQVRIKVKLTGRAWDWEGMNGCALMGVIAMNRYTSSTVDPVGMMNVIIHEIGHNMGQAYADKGTDPTFGRSSGNVVPGIAFPLPTASGGLVYGGRGHQGTHCAAGLSTADKASADYNDVAGGSTCVMFGSDDMSLSATRTFCADCVEYIKAENLVSVRKYWAS